MSKETIDFVKKFAPDIIKSVQGTGLFPSLAMAQMIIESSGNDANGKFGIGQGIAARRANNYFGVKADKSWQGQSVQLNTPRDGKPVSLFRVYPTPLDSMKDHTQFLLKNSRYKTNGVFIAKTPQEQAAALQRAGYSESPLYSKALITLIQDFHLEDLDKTGPGGFKGYLAIAAATILIASIYCFKDQIIGKLSPQQTLTQISAT